MEPWEIIGELLRNGRALLEKADMIMTQQNDIDNAVTVITNLLADVAAQTSQLVTDLANLQALIASGGPVTTTALDAIVGQAQAVDTALDTAVKNITAVAPGTTPPPVANP